MKAYLYVIQRANLKSLREAGEMFNIDLAWDNLLVETGYAARWEARGEARGRQEGILEIARKMKEMGFLAEQIQAVTGLPAESRN
jgi:predicted transposase YdaD